VAWGTARRAVLADAAERAGLPPPPLVAEPIAAAAYLASLPGYELRNGQTLVVYDLGAGTFDVCAIRCTSTGFEPVAHDGLDDFGGLDPDELIIGRVRDALAASAPDVAPEIWSRLAHPRSVADRRATQLLREDVRSAKEHCRVTPRPTYRSR
jgi:molecular chaperone DnaK (HSP70)